MNRNEVLKDIKEHCLIRLPVRFGKTKVAIEKIKEENPETILWVTPSAKLRDIDIPNEFKKWGADKYLSKTRIVTYSSLHKETGAYDKVILDEVQSITEANLVNFLNKELIYGSILAMTGTIPDTKEKRYLLQKLKLKLAVNVEDDDAVDGDIISDFNIVVLYTQLDNADKYLEGGNKVKRFFQTEVSKYKYLNSRIDAFKNDKKNKGKNLPHFLVLDRMHFIHNLKSKNEAAKLLLESLNERTIAFAANTTQANYICENSFHSKTNDEKLNKFINQEIDKISLVNSGGTGFTYKNLHNIIITQCDSNRLGATSQKVGRALLKETDKVATIYVICAKNTVDENWVESFLSDYNEDKIKRYKFSDFMEKQLNKDLSKTERKQFSDNNYLTKVSEFMEMFNQPVLDKPRIPATDRAQLRIDLIQEELNELKVAIESNDLTECLDAFLDLQYVLSGAVHEFGMGDIFKDAFDEVHASNMSKACNNEDEVIATQEFYAKRDGIETVVVERNGKYLVRRKNDNKQLKSVNYKAVDLSKFLK